MKILIALALFVPVVTSAQMRVSCDRVATAVAVMHGFEYDAVTDRALTAACRDGEKAAWMGETPDHFEKRMKDNRRKMSSTSSDYVAGWNAAEMSTTAGYYAARELGKM